jgi:hypothetical protein
MEHLHPALPVREPSVSEVRSELQVVLAARAFRQSRGLAKLLRYMCGRALVEDAEPVTEYTIAVDVLGKPQDFKESKDASVRVEVHRLRKRLADYYEQEGADHPVRIVIPTGQYTPQFLVCELSGEHKPVEVEMPHAPVPAVSDDTAAEVVHRGHWIPDRKRMQLWAACALGIALAIGAAAMLLRPTDPLDSFWHPVVASPNPILLCFGNVEGGRKSRTAAADDLSLVDYHALASQMMLVPDAITVSRFTGLLQAKGKHYRVASQSEATFADLQTGPAVLVGLANNDWTERLVGKLRFTLEHRPPGKLVLRDRQNPAHDEWAVDYRTPYLSLTRDYALVVRVLDPKTEQMVVTAAGLSSFGTLAAGDFLTKADEFRKILTVAPRGWQQKNFELILSTDVIRGKSGHPNIVAAHFW